jgi:hypothetical protein
MFSAVDGGGKPVSVQLQEGKLLLELEPAPQYVTLKRAGTFDR